MREEAHLGAVSVAFVDLSPWRAVMLRELNWPCKELKSESRLMEPSELICTMP